MNFKLVCACAFDRQQYSTLAETSGSCVKLNSSATIWEGVFADEVLLDGNSAGTSPPEQSMIVADVCTHA